MTDTPTPTPPPWQDWDPPRNEAGSNACKPAAVLVWVLGSLQMLLSGCCASSFAIYATVSLHELQPLLEGKLTATQLAQFHPWFGAIAATVFSLGFLPGLAYLILGFGVRDGKMTPINVTLVLAATQALVLGALLLVQILGVLLTISPAELTMAVVLLGTPLVLVVATWLKLWRLRNNLLDVMERETDPWDEPDH